MIPDSASPNPNALIPTPLPSPSPTLIPRAQPSTPSWRFWLPLAAQTILILLVPIQAVHTQATGTSVTLQTAPVDPYNLFRGYYVNLGYDISSPATLQKLPGWNTVDAAVSNPFSRRSRFQGTQDLYVILADPKTASAPGQPPKPWKPIAVRGDRPTNLPADQIALKGSYEGGWINYGLETYYIPEDDRTEINNQIAQLQAPTSQSPQALPFVVDIKVAADGSAVPISFWLDQKEYKY